MCSTQECATCNRPAIVPKISDDQTLCSRVQAQAFSRRKPPLPPCILEQFLIDSHLELVHTSTVIWVPFPCSQLFVKFSTSGTFMRHAPARRIVRTVLAVTAATSLTLLVPTADAAPGNGNGYGKGNGNGYGNVYALDAEASSELPLGLVKQLEERGELPPAYRRSSSRAPCLRGWLPASRPTRSSTQLQPRRPPPCPRSPRRTIPPTPT